MLSDLVSYKSCWLACSYQSQRTFPWFQYACLPAWINQPDSPLPHSVNNGSYSLLCKQSPRPQNTNFSSFLGLTFKAFACVSDPDTFLNFPCGSVQLSSQRVLGYNFGLQSGLATAIATWDMFFGMQREVRPNLPSHDIQKHGTKKRTGGGRALRHFSKTTLQRTHRAQVQVLYQCGWGAPSSEIISCCYINTPLSHRSFFFPLQDMASLFSPDSPKITL